ncbi:MAG: glycosyltransferase [Ignavibacteriales bacterium]|nr:MAG: glycosyltransferase [Ignavibacteriales bacterium]
MKILALTRYSTLGASSRFRIYQYLPYLQEHGCEFTVQPLLSDKYINHLYNKTPLPLLEIIKKYFERVLLLLRKNKFDIIWLQQEAFPWIPAWFETALIKSNVPVIVDYDDAFFHRYDQHRSKLVRCFLKNKIDIVMSCAEVVIAGNQYLAERAIKNKSKKVIILPTVVDTEVYSPSYSPANELFTIGWIGSPHTAKYLKIVEDALYEVCKDGNSRVIIVGSKNIELNSIPMEIREWSNSSEVEEIQRFDVGIMPLLDSSWERGKCGFKLIQYMACAKPVVASPVGVNKLIVKNNVNGFLANNYDEWVKYLTILKNDFDLRKRMGIEGRKLVEEKYSLQVSAPKLFQLFSNVLQEKS